MRKLSFLAYFTLCFSISYSQNPIAPAGVYFADPSAKLFPDGKLYLYGSLDESCDYYCSGRHFVMETSDMKNWVIHENAFSSQGEGDEVPYNDKVLYAPDCEFMKDSFYLYYCQPSATEAEGVAVSDNPAGPFKGGRRMNVGEHQEIDPSVFVDDDGEVYYIWGQFSLKMAKMLPGMRAIDSSSIVNGIITEQEHHFHEGAYMTKRNGIYYIVFADLSRGEKPTCLGYATSQSPFGPYKYGGVIIDNDECNPGNWNNHGSIAEFGTQWYVFYHRSTHNCNKMRKACVEPIYFNDDGSIDEVEMTSQGASGPIPARSRIEAEQACILHGNVYIRAFSGTEEELSMMYNGDKALFRYIDFRGDETKIRIRIRAGRDGGTIALNLDKPWHQRIATINIEGKRGKQEYMEYEFDIGKTTGVHPLYFQFWGDGDDMFSIDWFVFE